MTKKIYTYLVLFVWFLTTKNLTAQETVPYVLVSVAPHKFFIEQIAGDTIKVGLLVPAGASAHTYEPTPKQMLAASQAQMWFRIGEPFENKAIKAMQSYNNNLKVIDLRKGLDLIGSSCSHAYGGCHEHSMDLHFWLSPRMAQTQADTIAQALIENYPQHTQLYKENVKRFKQELQQLDQKIQAILQPLKNRSILVSHPAYAYFCRDYDLTQYSIEFEGKDPTPQQMNKVLKLARELNIHTVFVQMQYNNKGARLIANTIGAKVVTLDPYSEQYIKSLIEIAQAFAEG